MLFIWNATPNIDAANSVGAGGLLAGLKAITGVFDT